jgi:uncharacterized membrane protein YphA (DoxX/SURF4 family)
MRVFVGCAFLHSGLAKLGPWLESGELRADLARWALTNPLGFYRGLLMGKGLAYADLIAHTVAYTQIAIGACLVLGLLARAASAAGAVLTANYLLAAGHTGSALALPAALGLVCLVTLAACGAGRAFGLDRRLHQRAPVLPFTLLY